MYIVLRVKKESFRKVKDKDKNTERIKKIWRQFFKRQIKNNLV